MWVTHTRKSTILCFFLHPSSPVHAGHAGLVPGYLWRFGLSQRFPSPMKISSAASAWLCGLSIMSARRVLVREPCLWPVLMSAKRECRLFMGCRGFLTSLHTYPFENLGVQPRMTRPKKTPSVWRRTAISGLDPVANPFQRPLPGHVPLLLTAIQGTSASQLNSEKPPGS